MNDLINLDFSVGEVVLPLAISFFTFQQIAYLVDSYRGETHAHDFLSYALFVTFFPQLIAGPIVSHKEMLPQFMSSQSKTYSYRNLSVGLTLFTIGLFKKTIIADGIAVHADSVFSAALAGYSLNFLEAWTGSIAYTLQLYFDFSGYSDMALGLARIFGIRLPLNFNSPYKANSIIDFWRRWHITLSRFLREYLYFSLGGNKCGLCGRYRNLFITMLLGGLWHGAAWTFVLWGALHGIYLIINHAWRYLRSFLPETNIHLLTIENIIYRGLTFVAVVVGWVYFRAENIDVAHNVLAGMAGIQGITLPREWLSRYPQYQQVFSMFNIDFQPLLSVGRMMTPIEDFKGFISGQNVLVSVGPISALLTMIPLLFWVWLAPNTQQFLHHFNPAIQAYSGQIKPLKNRFFQWKINIFWAIFVAFLAAYSIFGSNKTTQFLYFNF